MTPRFRPTAAFTALCIFLLAAGGALAQASAPPRQPAPSSPTKAATPSSRLLLTLYAADISSSDGATTIFAVRNELDVPVDIDIHYYRTHAPQAPQRTDRKTLQPKQVHPVNLHFVPNLEVDDNNVARGYVIVEAITEGARIQGDYYRVTPNEDFATGFRLVNADLESPNKDLCNLFSLRFLNGGGFDSGTTFTIWLDLAEAPSSSDPIFFVAAYDEPGNLLLARSYFADEVVVEVTAEELLSPLSSEDFGSMEFQFADGAVGHVSAVLSAENRYSVGLEASCSDP